MRFVSIVSLGVAALGVRTVSAQCTRWQNNLSHCEVSSAFCASPAPTPTDGQLQYYNNWRYGDDPAQVCERWAKKTSDNPNGYIGRSTPTGSDPSETYQTRCYLDENNNGSWQDNEKSTLAEKRTDIVRESCCELTPWGPHRDVTPNVWYSFGQLPNSLIQSNAPADGLEFTSYTHTLLPASQRVRLLERVDIDPAPGLSGAYLSDMFRPRPFDLSKYEYCGGALDDDGGLCHAHVDHIIPRKDISGCDCGPNSYANALVISARLNREMSNRCSNPKRLAILEKYTFEGQYGPIQPYAAPASSIDECEPDDQECHDAVLTGEGGCSAASGGLGFAFGLGVLAFARRRRVAR